MPRTQNAHAIVNAGFLVKIENDLVKTANIVYGAINKGFVHASKTEKILIGKKLYDDTTLQAIFDSLNTELVPDHVLPDPSITFRKGIAISLFYKVRKHTFLIIKLSFSLIFFWLSFIINNYTIFFCCSLFLRPALQLRLQIDLKVAVLFWNVLSPRVPKNMVLLRRSGL